MSEGAHYYLKPDPVSARPMRFEDLSKAQRRACHAFAKRFGLHVDDVAQHLDTFFRITRGEITLLAAETQTGLTIIDRQTPSLFAEPL